MGKQTLSRREFLRFIALTSAGAVLASCASPASQTTEPAATSESVSPTSVPQTTSEKIVLNLMDNWGSEDNGKAPPLYSTFDDLGRLPRHRD